VPDEPTQNDLVGTAGRRQTPSLSQPKSSEAILRIAHGKSTLVAGRQWTDCLRLPKGIEGGSRQITSVSAAAEK
jgi:hypothetical protein